MDEKVLVAGVQMDIEIKEKQRNLAKARSSCEEASRHGARIVIFPELTLTGYAYADVHEIASVSEPVPGPSTESLHRMCKEHGILALVGLIERHEGSCFNSATLIGPEGIVGTYRKVHLPYLGADKLVSPGDTPFTVYETPYGRLGWIICYDGSFPESVRVLALKGAELVALCTNWPDDPDSACSQKYIVPARAVENHVNYFAVNRVGCERGVAFLGKSIFVDFEGHKLAEASPDKEEIIYGEVDLRKARESQIVVAPGQYEMDRMKHRRPEFYGPICELSP